MTTRAEMTALYETATATVPALRQIGAGHVANRLHRCMIERRHRQPGRRNWSCRGIACPWCSRTLVTRWHAGLIEWIGTGASVSVVRVPLVYVPGELRSAVRAFRRALRDTRDRQVRRPGQQAWRPVEFAGTLGADGIAVMHCGHDGLARGEVAAVVSRRWPGAVVLGVETAAPPSVAWCLEDRVALGLLRRGAEPLRVLVQAQHDRNA